MRLAMVRELSVGDSGFDADEMLLLAVVLEGVVDDGFTFSSSSVSVSDSSLVVSSSLLDSGLLVLAAAVAVPPADPVGLD